MSIAQQLATVPRNALPASIGYLFVMTSTAKQMREYTGSVLFSFGFRPFFLGGAIMAALTPLITALAYSGAITIDTPGGIIAWHSHEMIYGYVSAIIAGFILTAVPNWTGRLPLMGPPLIGLCALWLAGRVSMLLLGGMPAALIDSAFLFVLDIFLWREVLAGKNWRNAPICLLVLFFATGNAIWHYENITGSGGMYGLHLSIGAIAILLALIGGRVTPSFTRNWLVKTGKNPKDMPFATFDKLTIGALIIAILFWVFAAQLAATGYLLILAGLLHFARLTRWQGLKTAAEPLVLILHIGYLWLAIGAGLMGLSILMPSVFTTATALHALTAGAMGVMTLAVMTRAVRGHTGRALKADRITIAIYVLVNIGAILRVLTPFFAMPYALTMLLSSVIWGSAFALFSIVYGRYLLSPRLQS